MAAPYADGRAGVQGSRTAESQFSAIFPFSMRNMSNLVVVSLVSELPDPADSSKKYTTTWFDMFRIENGKIAEHWDSAVRLP
jgi:predicted SnoaL-like aldol condensation-catalyzing enzyme